LYVAIKLEAWLSGGKFEGCKTSELPASTTYIILQASKMLFIPFKGAKLHMARNIFHKHKVVINVMLSNFFVEAVKISPFNGSNFVEGLKAIFSGTSIMPGREF
jgi:hypothetical protein